MSRESRHVLVAGLSEAVEEHTVKDFFACYGKVQKLEKCDNGWVVSFQELRSAQKALNGGRHISNGGEAFRLTFHEMLTPSKNPSGAIGNANNTTPMTSSQTGSRANGDSPRSGAPDRRRTPSPMKKDSRSGRSLPLSGKRPREVRHTGQSPEAALSRTSGQQGLWIERIPARSLVAKERVEEEIRDQLRKYGNISHVRLVDVDGGDTRKALVLFQRVWDRGMLGDAVSVGGQRVRLRAATAIETAEAASIQQAEMQAVATGSRGVDRARPCAVNSHGDPETWKTTDGGSGRNAVYATRSIWVGCLDRGETDQSLKERYSKYGEIVDVDIKNAESDSPFGFVQFAHIDSAVKAINNEDARPFYKHGQQKRNPYFATPTATNKLWIGSIPETVTEEYLSEKMDSLFAHSLERGISPVNYDPKVKEVVVVFRSVEAAAAAIAKIRSKEFQFITDPGDTRVVVDFCSDRLHSYFVDRKHQHSASTSVCSAAVGDAGLSVLAPPPDPPSDMPRYSSSGGYSRHDHHRRSPHRSRDRSRERSRDRQRRRRSRSRYVEKSRKRDRRSSSAASKCTSSSSDSSVDSRRTASRSPVRRRKERSRDDRKDRDRSGKSRSSGRRSADRWSDRRRSRSPMAIAEKMMGAERTSVLGQDRIHSGDIGGFCDENTRLHMDGGRATQRPMPVPDPSPPPADPPATLRTLPPPPPTMDPKPTTLWSPKTGVTLGAVGGNPLPVPPPPTVRETLHPHTAIIHQVRDQHPRELPPPAPFANNCTRDPPPPTLHLQREQSSVKEVTRDPYVPQHPLRQGSMTEHQHRPQPVSQQPRHHSMPGPSGLMSPQGSTTSSLCDRERNPHEPDGMHLGHYPARAPKWPWGGHCLSSSRNTINIPTATNPSLVDPRRLKVYPAKDPMLHEWMAVPWTASWRKEQKEKREKEAAEAKTRPFAQRPTIGERRSSGHPLSTHSLISRSSSSAGSETARQSPSDSAPTTANEPPLDFYERRKLLFETEQRLSIDLEKRTSHADDTSQDSNRSDGQSFEDKIASLRSRTQKRTDFDLLIPSRSGQSDGTSSRQGSAATPSSSTSSVATKTGGLSTCGFSKNPTRPNLSISIPSNRESTSSSDQPPGSSASDISPLSRRLSSNVLPQRFPGTPSLSSRPSTSGTSVPGSAPAGNSSEFGQSSFVPPLQQPSPILSAPPVPPNLHVTSGRRDSVSSSIRSPTSSNYGYKPSTPSTHPNTPGSSATTPTGRPSHSGVRPSQSSMNLLPGTPRPAGLPSKPVTPRQDSMPCLKSPIPSTSGAGASVSRSQSISDNAKKPTMPSKDPGMEFMGWLFNKDSKQQLDMKRLPKIEKKSSLLDRERDRSTDKESVQSSKDREKGHKKNKEHKPRRKEDGSFETKEERQKRKELDRARRDNYKGKSSKEGGKEHKKEKERKKDDKEKKKSKEEKEKRRMMKDKQRMKEERSEQKSKKKKRSRRDSSEESNAMESDGELARRLAAQFAEEDGVAGQSMYDRVKRRSSAVSKDEAKKHALQALREKAIEKKGSQRKGRVLVETSSGEDDAESQQRDSNASSDEDDTGAKKTLSEDGEKKARKKSKKKKKERVVTSSGSDDDSEPEHDRSKKSMDMLFGSNSSDDDKKMATMDKKPKKVKKHESEGNEPPRKKRAHDEVLDMESIFGREDKSRKDKEHKRRSQEDEGSKHWKRQKKSSTRSELSTDEDEHRRLLSIGSAADISDPEPPQSASHEPPRLLTKNSMEVSDPEPKQEDSADVPPATTSAQMSPRVDPSSDAMATTSADAISTPPRLLTKAAVKVFVPHGVPSTSAQQVSSGGEESDDSTAATTNAASETRNDHDVYDRDAFEHESFDRPSSSLQDPELDRSDNLLQEASTSGGGDAFASRVRLSSSSAYSQSGHESDTDSHRSPVRHVDLVDAAMGYQSIEPEEVELVVSPLRAEPTPEHVPEPEPFVEPVVVTTTTTTTTSSPSSSAHVHMSPEVNSDMFVEHEEEDVVKEEEPMEEDECNLSAPETVSVAKDEGPSPNTLSDTPPKSSRENRASYHGAHDSYHYVDYGVKMDDQKETDNAVRALFDDEEECEGPQYPDLGQLMASKEEDAAAADAIAEDDTCGAVVSMDQIMMEAPLDEPQLPMKDEDEEEDDMKRRSEPSPIRSPLPPPSQNLAVVDELLRKIKEDAARKAEKERVAKLEAEKAEEEERVKREEEARVKLEMEARVKKEEEARVKKEEEDARIKKETEEVEMRLKEEAEMLEAEVKARTTPLPTSRPASNVPPVVLSPGLQRFMQSPVPSTASTSFSVQTSVPQQQVQQQQQQQQQQQPVQQQQQFQPSPQLPHQQQQLHQQPQQLHSQPQQLHPQPQQLHPQPQQLQPAQPPSFSTSHPDAFHQLQTSQPVVVSTISATPSVIQTKPVPVVSPVPTTSVVISTSSQQPNTSASISVLPPSSFTGGLTQGLPLLHQQQQQQMAMMHQAAAAVSKAHSTASPARSSTSSVGHSVNVPNTQATQLLLQQQQQQQQQLMMAQYRADPAMMQQFAAAAMQMGTNPMMYEFLLRYQQDMVARERQAAEAAAAAQQLQQQQQQQQQHRQQHDFSRILGGSSATTSASSSTTSERKTATVQPQQQQQQHNNCRLEGERVVATVQPQPAQQLSMNYRTPEDVYGMIRNFDCEIVWEGQLIMQAKEAASKMIYLNGSHAIIREAFGAYFADAKQEAIRVKQRMKIVPNMNNTINSLMSGRYAVMLCMAGLVSNASSGDSEISQLEQANAYFKTAFTDYFLAKSCAGVAPLETPNGLFTANVFARGYEFVNHLLSSYSPTLFNHLNTRDISYLLVILNQPDPKTT